LGPVLAVDPELGVVVQVGPVEGQVVEFVEQEGLPELEEVELALCLDLEEVDSTGLESNLSL
jgi:hypothetical protein